MNHPITCPFCRQRELDTERMREELEKALNHRDYFSYEWDRVIETGAELIKEQKQRAKQAEAELEQMTAKCAVLTHVAQQAYDEQPWAGLGIALFNTPASVEKLLAVVRAAEKVYAIHRQGGTCHCDICSAVRAMKEKP